MPKVLDKLEQEEEPNKKVWIMIYHSRLYLTLAAIVHPRSTPDRDIPPHPTRLVRRNSAQPQAHMPQPVSQEQACRRL